MRTGTCWIAGEARVGIIEIEFKAVEEICNGQPCILELKGFLDPLQNF